MLVLEPGAVSRHDLTGNGRADYIIDFTYVRCERLGSIFCGTGGCELSIVVALPRGKFREVFRQQAIRYEMSERREHADDPLRSQRHVCARPARSRAENAGSSPASGSRSSSLCEPLGALLVADRLQRSVDGAHHALGRILDQDLAGELQR